MSTQNEKTLGKAVEKTLVEIATDGRQNLEQAYYAVLEGDGSKANKDQIIDLMGHADSALEAVQTTAYVTIGLVDTLTEDLRGAAKKAERLAEQLKATATDNQDLREQLRNARSEIRRLNEQIETAVDSALQTGIDQGWRNAQIAYDQ